MKQNCIQYEKLLFIIFSTVLCLLCVGCNEPRQPKEPDWQAQIEQLENELQQSRLLLEQRDKQIVSLQKLPDDYIDNIVSVRGIDLGRYTRIEDTNGDLKVDSLVVYMVIKDKSADKVKIAGSCTIELWDLEAPEDNNMVNSWVFSPTELDAHWDGLLGASYRFNLTVDDYKTGNNNLTVKCRFNELITGKVFETQKMLTLKK